MRLKSLSTQSYNIVFHISVSINYPNCLVSHLPSMKGAWTPAMESLVNDECWLPSQAKSWITYLFLLQNWCTHWQNISQLITFLPNTSTNCRWMLFTVGVCAHKNGITVCGNATCIGKSIIIFWFRHIYCPVHLNFFFEIFICYHQSHTQLPTVWQVPSTPSQVWVSMKNWFIPGTR